MTASAARVTAGTITSPRFKLRLRLQVERSGRKELVAEGGGGGRGARPLTGRLGGCSEGSTFRSPGRRLDWGDQAP